MRDMASLNTAGLAHHIWPGKTRILQHTPPPLQVANVAIDIHCDRYLMDGINKVIFALVWGCINETGDNPI